MTAFKKAKPREKSDSEVVRIRCRSFRKRKSYNTGVPTEIYYENENNNVPSEKVNLIIVDIFLGEQRFVCSEIDLPYLVLL